ncbi:MAG: hypothetical protein ACFB11_14380 [Paracoccaceae bacterium]
MAFLSEQNGVQSQVTRIPDGDNQARSSAFPGEIFKLGIGDQTQVVNKPVLTLNDLATGLLNAGIAETKGATSTIILEAEKSFVVNYKPGVIASEGTGIDVTGDHGKVLNNGLTTGDVNGARLAGEDGRLVNFGDVRSDSRAIDIVGVGTKIFNYGDITGTGDQRNGTVYADNGAEDITLVNGKRGSIDAGFGNDGAGVSFELGDRAGEAVGANITNHGLIAGRGDAKAGLNTRGDGIRLFSGVEDGAATYDGNIFNTGQITSDNARGIEIRDNLGFDGKILNKGLIFGETDGLYFGDAEHDAKVLNRGTIASDSRAVNIDGDGVDLVNSGDIVGTDVQRNGTVYADRTADDYKILNLKGGLIKAQDGGSAVSLQTGDANGDVVLAGVKNLGRIIGGGDAETGNQVGDGVRLFSSVKDAVFDGDIFNAGLVRASKYSDAAVGISIEDGIKLDGAILNYGRIVANAVAIDATEAGGHVNIVNAGVIRGGVNLSDGNDHYDSSYGRTAGVVEGGNGHDVLEGGFARDLLAGGQGDDELTGGYGRDVFIFRASDAKSEDVITDFEDHRDRIDVSHFGYSSLQQIGVAQKGDDVVLTFAKDNTVTLRDTGKADIGVDDFIF